VPNTQHSLIVVFWDHRVAYCSLGFQPRRTSLVDCDKAATKSGSSRLQIYVFAAATSCHTRFPTVTAYPWFVECPLMAMSKSYWISSSSSSSPLTPGSITARLSFGEQQVKSIVSGHAELLGVMWPAVSSTSMRLKADLDSSPRTSCFEWS
jgi:hypothetical protein